MNVAWRIKSNGEGVAQAEKSEIVLMNTEFKENIIHVENMDIKNANVLKRINQKMKK